MKFDRYAHHVDEGDGPW